MPRKLNVFPATRYYRVDWTKYADGNTWLFTPSDGMYSSAKKFRTAARTWAKRHGYDLSSALIPADNEGEQPSVAVRFRKQLNYDSKEK